MAVELSFVLITPYSLMKSRTGGIIARLLSRTDLDLVGAQMLTPSKEFAETYAASMRKHVGKRDEFAAKLFSDYMLDNLSPLPDGSRERVLMLLFKGEDACAKLSAVVGQLPNAKNRKTNIIGETSFSTVTVRSTTSSPPFSRRRCMTPVRSVSECLQILRKQAKTS